MNKQITRTSVCLGMLFVLVASASAQTARRITAQVPFGFVAGQKQLPAGRYTVSPIKRDGQNALLVRSENGRNVAIVLTNSAKAAPTRASLDFRQYGDRLFLAGVSIPGAAEVREVPRSDVEKNLERELSEQAKAGDAGVKTVTVAGSIQ